MLESTHCKGMVFLGITILLVPQLTWAGWSRTYGGAGNDYGYSILETSDGCYIVVGETESFAGSRDLWLLKIDGDGDTQWARTYGDNSIDYGSFVQQARDGGYIITGVKNAQGYGTNGDLWLIKVDSLGDSTWSRSYGKEGFTDSGKSVFEAESEGYMVFGVTESEGSGKTDVWILRVDQYGDTLWTRTYGEEDIDYPVCVQRSHQLIDGYIMYVRSYTMGDQLVRIDTSGQVYSADEAPGGEIYYIQENWSGGGYLCVGWWVSSPEDPSDIFLGVTDFFYPSMYEMEWMWGGEGVQEGYCVENAPGSYTYIVTGLSCRFDENSQLILSKVGGYGFDRFYGGDGIDYGVRVLPTSDSGYIVLGVTESYGAGNYDIWLIKTDSLGNLDIKEQPVTHRLDFELSNLIGREIVLRYSNHPQGFHVTIYDVSGRRVDEIRAVSSSGTITWGEGHSPGVYFIRSDSDVSTVTQRVILLK